MAHMMSIEDESCRKCGIAPETAAHILTECPALWRERRQAFGEAFPEVGKKNLTDFVKFVKKIRFSCWTAESD